MIFIQDKTKDMRGNFEIKIQTGDWNRLKRHKDIPASSALTQDYYQFEKKILVTYLPLWIRIEHEPFASKRLFGIAMLPPFSVIFLLKNRALEKLNWERLFLQVFRGFKLVSSQVTDKDSADYTSQLKTFANL